MSCLKILKIVNILSSDLLIKPYHEKLHMGRNMIINQTPNILYKSRIGHKQKPYVTEGQLSDNSFNETPLMRESKSISFKGVSSENVSKFAKKIFNKIRFVETKGYNIDESIKIIKEHYDSSVTSLINNVNGKESIKENIVHIGNNKSRFKEKSILRSLFDGIIYPVKDLPMQIADGIVGFARKHKIIKGEFQKDSNHWFGKARNKLDDADKFNSLLGFVKAGNKYKYDTEKVRSAALFKDGMKMFDPKSGNYNSVHERALTRIVTGFIPAFFLANDAYNLSRIMNDKEKEADAEAKLRFKQESKRVVSNAYIQLITLGALAKYVNGSKKVFIGVTLLTTLFTEIYSRLSNGKKIHFISKKEAQEINEKEAAAKKQTAPIDNQTQTKEKESHPSTSKANPAFAGSKVFDNFGIASDIKFEKPASVKVGSVNDTKEEIKTQEIADKNGKELKPLLSVDTIVKWVVGTITIGFAIKGLRAMKFKRGNKDVKVVDEIFQKVSKKYDAIYKKITKQENIIKKADFDNLTNKLINYDKKLGLKYQAVTHNYLKTQSIKNFAADIAKDLEKLGNKELANDFKLIAEQKALQGKSFISKTRTNAAIMDNLEHFCKKLSENGEPALAKEIKETLIKTEKGSTTIDLNKYQKISKMLSKLADTRKESNFDAFKESFPHIFMVNEEEVILNLYKEAGEKLKNKSTSLLEKYENQITKTINQETYNLGSKDRAGVKQAVDFVIQPFKFLWNTLTFPYKAVNTVIRNTKTNTPKWSPEIDVVTNSWKKLHKASLQKENQFKAELNKKISKAFNSTTMSNVSNADLSELAKYTTTGATAWFLIADNYNMVMLKSNGEEKDEAKLKAKERAVQETSRLFYSQLLINLFNSTFRDVYNANLLGAETVNAVSTSLGEYMNRTAIGMPVKKSTRDEILTQEQENMNSTGAKGKFFRFMSRLTGKRVLSQREPIKKKPEQ